MIIEIILEYIIGFIVVGFILAIAFCLYTKRKEEMKAVTVKDKEDITYAMFDFLTELSSKKNSSNGKLTAKERKKAEQLYNVYKDLGGDGNFSIYIKGCNKFVIEHKLSKKKVALEKVYGVLANISIVKIVIAGEPSMRMILFICMVYCALLSLFVYGWCWQWRYQDTLDLPMLLNGIKEMSAPAVLAALQFFINSLNDSNGNGIPDTLEGRENENEKN